MKKIITTAAAEPESQPRLNLNQKVSETAAEPELKTWQNLNIISNPPLNLNLIIPFKDKKGLKKNILKQRLKEFEEQLHQRVDAIREEVSEQIQTHPDVGLSITARVSSGITKYFWRETARESKRAYTRLFKDSTQEFLYSRYDRREFLVLKEAEEELIYINANLKLLKTMEAAIKTADEEVSKLLHLQTPL